MTPESLDAALAAAAGEASSLRMVAFSHLDLAGWCEREDYTMQQGSASSSSVEDGPRLIAQPNLQAPAGGSLQVKPLDSCR